MRHLQELTLHYTLKVNFNSKISLSLHPFHLPFMAVLASTHQAVQVHSETETEILHTKWVSRGLYKIHVFP